MKKSISAILVAALMLFAFTACEQQMPTYKVPTGLTISTTKTAYLVGETLDASAFSGVVRYSDGSSDTLSGADLSLSLPAQNGKIVANANKVTATYGAVNASGKANSVSASTTVYGYYVTSMTLGNLPETVAQSVSGGDADQPISTEGVTATVVYNGQTRELAAGEFTIGSLTIDTQNPTAEGAEGTDIDVADVKVFGTTVQPANIETGKAVVTAYVDDDPDKVFDANKIKSIAVGYLDEDDDFVTSGVTVYYGDSTSVFAVQATDENNNTQVLTSGYTIQVKNGNLETTSETDVVAILTADPTIKSSPLKVTPQNYIVAISAAMVDGQTIDNNTATDPTTSGIGSKYKITATMAADVSEGVKTKELSTASDIAFSVAYFQQPTTAYTVIYTGSEENPAKPVANTTLAVTFTKV